MHVFSYGLAQGEVKAFSPGFTSKKASPRQAYLHGRAGVDAGLAPSGSGRWLVQGQSPLLLRCQTPAAEAAPPALSGISGTHWYRISLSAGIVSV